MEPNHLFAALVPPLVKCPSGLVVPQAWRDMAVEHQLATGQGDGHYSEGLLLEMMENVNIAHGAGRVAGGDPSLVGLIVQHHIGSGSPNAKLQLHVGGLIKSRTERGMRLKFSKMKRTRMFIVSKCLKYVFNT